MNIINTLFRNIRTDTRIWNKAYQKGFEEGVKRANHMALESVSYVVKGLDAQIKHEARKSDPPKAERIIEGISVGLMGIDTRVFFADTFYSCFEIHPNKDGYAMWSNIDEKFKEKK